MNSLEPKKYEIPASLNEWIEKQLKALGWNLSQSKKLAKNIMEVSSHFQETESKTPWNSKAKTAAYLAYFLPLNYIRTLKVIDEAKDFGFFENIDSVIDLGCGPGTSSRALMDQTSIKTFTGIDESRILSPMFLSQSKNHQLFYKMQPPARAKKTDLLLASYVLNEMKELPSWVLHYDKIILIEPSTHQAFPQLLQTRQKLIEENWNILAPCPHHLECPLKGSKKDWCHDRVHWRQPDWFQAITNHLPMRNNTLTFSYMIARKNKRSEVPYSRIVGDPLIEKGKTRWLLCENDQKKYLSFLKRDGAPPNLQRGNKVQIKNGVLKGKELRFTNESLDVL